jgi:hypothetical protein
VGSYLEGIAYSPPEWGSSSSASSKERASKHKVHFDCLALGVIKLVLLDAVCASEGGTILTRVLVAALRKICIRHPK